MRAAASATGKGFLLYRKATRQPRPYPCKISITGVADVALRSAWAKGAGVHRIAGPSSRRALAPKYRPRPLLRPAMASSELDELIEAGMLAFARPKEPDRSRYAQVRHRDLLDRRHLEMGGNKRQSYPGGDEG
jgi:hypothetical protein